MYGAFLPPEPDLFGHEGQDRCEQSKHRGEGHPQRVLGRRRTGLITLVGTALDQLHVVVGEGPEEGLGALKGPGVVEALEGSGCLVDQVGKAGKHRLVEWVGYR